MTKRLIEIRPGEGGDEAKRLTVELGRAYERFFDRQG